MDLFNMYSNTFSECEVPADQPIDWCSAMSIQSKRICIDPCPLNLAIQRELYELPVLEDLLAELSKAKVFSKLDLLRLPALRAQ